LVVADGDEWAGEIPDPKGDKKYNIK